MNTPQVEINRRNSPQIKRSFALLTAATSTAYGPAINVGHGFAFAIFVKGTGATGTNRIIIEARNESNVWATWKDIAVATGNTTQLVEAISAVSAVRAKVTPYGGGSFDVTIDVLNVKAIEQGATPAEIDWSNLTNKPATFTPATHAHAASEITDLGPLVASKAQRGGIISTGASAVGATQNNTGLAAGTSNRSGGLWVRLPDWTPAANVPLWTKFASNLGTKLWVTTTGLLRLEYGNGSNFSTYRFDSTVATGVADGAWAFIAWSEDRAGNVSFYVNGALLGAAVSISAASAQTVTNTGALLWGSDGTTHAVGTFGESFIVSGLLTATQVADIYRAGSIAPFSASFTFFQWCDFGQGYGPIIKDRSGQNQPALMGTSGLTHAGPRNPPGVPQRAPRVAIACDGSSGSFVRNALGAQAPLAGEFAMYFDWSAEAGATTSLVLATEAAVSTIPGLFRLTYGTTTGHLRVDVFGATVSDYNRWEASNLLTLLSGKRRGGAVVRNLSGNPSIYIGGDGDWINVTNLGAFTSGGTPPTWQVSVPGNYLVSQPAAQSVFDLRLANVAMTEAQLRTEYERGEPGPEWMRGTNTALYTSNFSAGVDGWAAGSSDVAVTGNVDSINGQNDWLQVERTVSTGALIAGSSDSKILKNSGIRVRLRVYIDPVVTGFSFFSVMQDGGTVIGTQAVVAGAQYDIDVSAAVGAGSSGSDTRIYVRASTSTGGAINVPVGDKFYIKSVISNPTGYTSRLRTDTAAGLTALDGSTNKNDFLLSTTGVTVSPDGRRQIIRPGTLTFGGAGTQQLFGASVVDTGSKWRVVSVSGTSNASVNLSLGNTGSGTQYVNAQAVTAADFDIGTFASRVVSGANLYLTLSGAGIITDPVIILEKTN